MKYSFIFPYRDRRDNLNAQMSHLPSMLQEANIDYEVIIAEQADAEAFRRGNLRDEGFRAATGDIIVFNDIDYVAQAGMSYLMPPDVDVYLPVRSVDFVYNTFEPCHPKDISSGYTHFVNAVDDNFWGGCIMMTREAVEKVNGWNTLMIDWGEEDNDLRERCYYYGLRIKRGVNKFRALYHPPSGVTPEQALIDKNYQHNRNIFLSWTSYLSFGLSDEVTPDVVEVTPKHPEVTTWLEITNIPEIE